MSNCSDILPYSVDYYTAIGKEKLYFLYVDVVLTLLVLAVFAEECYFVVKTYRHYNIAIKSIWLISIYPVFAVSALLAVCIPRAVYLCDFVSAVYLSACLFQFSSLLLLYFGNGRKMLDTIQDSGFSLRTRPLCCCCVCCPVLPPTRRSLIIVRVMIFQTVVAMPINQFVSAVLWADDRYSPSGIEFTDSYIYLTILKVASTITAIYGVNALHEPTRLHLCTFNTVPKRTALILVQVFFNIQGAVLMLLGRYDVLGCHDGFSSYFQMLEWHHLVLVVEMFLLSVLARLYYRRPLELDAILEERHGDLSAIYTTDLPNDQVSEQRKGADNLGYTDSISQIATPTSGGESREVISDTAASPHEEASVNENYTMGATEVTGVCPKLKTLEENTATNSTIRQSDGSDNGATPGSGTAGPVHASAERSEHKHPSSSEGKKTRL